MSADAEDGDPDEDPSVENGEAEEETRVDQAELPGVSDSQEKNITIFDKSGDWIEHTQVYLCHSNDSFYVSEDKTFPEDDRIQYDKSDIERIKVDQHHPTFCFITTATAGQGPTLESLRGFRDEALEPSLLGRGLVRFYYAVSPPIAETISRHRDSRTTSAVRRFVDMAASLADRRSEAERDTSKSLLSATVTAIYFLGMIVALGGHSIIRGREMVTNRHPGR
jgi:hypothetical protein